MLSDLLVTNLAVVEEATVRFGEGLSVLTGETGAGKSILVGAVDLLVGGRAGAEWLRKGADRCAVEGVFRLDGASRARIASLLGEDGDEVSLRREIGSDGRSRAFVNGRSASVGLLKEAGKLLVDLHGQHEHQTLLDPATHVDFLDRHASLGPLLEEVRERRRALSECAARAEDLASRMRRREERLDALSHQIREIEEARFRPDEEEPLRAERSVFRNAGRLAAIYASVSEGLDGEEGAAASRIGRAARSLRAAEEVDPTAKALAAEAQALEESVLGVARAVRDRIERLEADPDRRSACGTSRPS